MKWQKIGFVCIKRQMRFSSTSSLPPFFIPISVYIIFSLSLFILSLFLSLFPSYILPCSLFLYASFFSELAHGLMGTALVAIVTSRYEHVIVCVLCSKYSPYDTDTLSHAHLRLTHDWIVKDKSN